MTSYDDTPLREMSTVKATLGLVLKGRPTALADLRDDLNNLLRRYDVALVYETGALDGQRLQIVRTNTGGRGP